MAHATLLVFCALRYLRSLDLIALFDEITISNCKRNLLF